MRQFIAAIFLVFAGHLPACAFTLLFSDLGDLPVSGQLQVRETPIFEGDRILASVSLEAPDLWADLDALARAEGNFGSWEHRLYFVGPTRLISAAGRDVRLSSHARYENWVRVKVIFDEIKTKLLQDTKTVDLSLQVQWYAQARAFGLTYRLDNIHNFPGALERLARSLGAKMEGKTTVSASDHPLFDALDPQISDWSLRPFNDGNGLAIDIDLSLDRKAVMTEAGAALGLDRLVPDIVGGALRLIGWGR